MLIKLNKLAKQASRVKYLYILVFKNSEKIFSLRYRNKKEKIISRKKIKIQKRKMNITDSSNSSFKFTLNLGLVTDYIDYITRCVALIIHLVYVLFIIYFKEFKSRSMLFLHHVNIISLIYCIHYVFYTGNQTASFANNQVSWN